MENVNLTVIVVSFALYTLAIIAVGMYSARFAKRSDEDYFLAGRSLGPWIAALSASASAESGWVTMGLVGMAFATGFNAYWLIPGVGLGYLFNWFFLAARLRERSAACGALTIPDLFSLHFRERIPLLRILSVIVIMVAMLLYVAAQFAAAGKAFDITLGANVQYWHGVLIGGGVVLAYSVLGGFRAACWTDFLQGLIMIGALVGFPLYLMLTQGGYGYIHEQLASVADKSGQEGGLLRFLPEKSGFALIGFLLGSGALGVNFGYPGQPHILIRYMAMKDKREAVRGGVIAMIWMVLVIWGAVTIGVLARAMAEGGAAWGQDLLADMASANTTNLHETALIVAAANMLPGVIAGLVLAAVLAAICSTADSQLVVAASSVANDIYTRLFRPKSEKSHMFVNRAVLFLLGAGAVVLVLDQQVNVYTYVLTYGWAVLGAAFGPQLILLLLWKRASYAGCVTGMAIGFALPIFWNLTYGAEPRSVEIYNLTLSFIVAMIANVVMSLLIPDRREPVQPEPA